MSKNILITGATGKQGGGVIKHLLNNPSFTLLALTRNSSSASAQALAKKGTNIKLIQGDQNDVPALFKSALKVTNGSPIWGIFSVQVAGPGEVKQGCDMIDEAKKHGVKCFTYSSIERGGDEESWKIETTVPHFQTKYKVEHYLKEHAGSEMAWTILRPTAFMDNLAPGFPAKVFLAAMRDTLGDKPLQWIASSDIGAFAKIVFENPEEWNRKALGLAGEEQTVAQLCEKVERKTGVSVQPTFWVFGTLLKKLVNEMGVMLDWFGSDGYKADIPKLRKIYPGLMDFEAWLEKESPFPRK
ncbi:NmrA-like family domain-containing protein 1 [Pseudocercospora fuligena]|uniref:NmrA-like family domain-containing protein 1 n=1 Tax=Pseudocercospora fuligena TaxID=685502 RepID=A0A8H6VDH1_9PEZI|nr:NmrA-like family domain-containing protein 1 [Pseudocercospora fuligena]